MSRVFRVFFVLLTLFPFSAHAFDNQEDPLEESMKVWAQEAIRNVLSYDYENYKSRRKEVKPFFTNKGYETYLQKSSEDDDLLDRVVDGLWSLDTIARPDPRVGRKSMLFKETDIDGEDRKSWAIVAPVTMYKRKIDKFGSLRHSDRNYLVAFRIKQRDLKAPYDFVITEWIKILDYDGYWDNPYDYLYKLD